MKLNLQLYHDIIDILTCYLIVMSQRRTPKPYLIN